MPKTIIAGFNKLKTNLEITTLQKTTVSTRQTNVRKAVSDDFNIIESFLSGSHPRSTMISPLEKSDVDIFLILKSEYFYSYTPSSLLDKIRKSLLKTYPLTPKISRNGQAVTITFSDFKVDVVPSFNRKGGGYLIPDSITDTWISTDPLIHASNLTEANDLHNGYLIPLIKMIKGWNRSIGEPFYGFYLEILVKEILNDIEISSYSSGVRYIFDKARDRVLYILSDPVGFGGEIDGLKNISNIDDAVKKFNTAYGRAIKAENYESLGNTSLAFSEWQKIFPKYFPSYG